MHRLPVFAGLLAAIAGLALTVAHPGGAVTVAVLAGVAALALAGVAAAVLRRPADRVLAAVAVVVLVGIGGLVVLAVASGWPGPGPGVLAAGALVTTGGIVAGTRRAGPASRRALRVAAIAAAAGTAALALGAGTLVDGLALSTSTAPASAAPEPPEPTGLDGVSERWRWAPGQRVRGVVAAGSGVVAVAGAEVVGLDPATGRPRWSHRRLGVLVRTLVATPDRRSVVLVEQFGDPPRDDWRGGSLAERDAVLTVLDADTGAARWSLPVAEGPAQVTDAVVTAAQGQDASGEAYTRVLARSIATGEPSWSAGPGPGCEFRLTDTVPARDAVVAVRDCPGPLGDLRRVRAELGLDDRDGHVRWSLPARPLSPRALPETTAPVDAGGRWVAGPTPGPDERPALVDSATGAVVAGSPGQDAYYDDVGPALIVRGPADTGAQAAGVIDPATGRALPVPACAADPFADPTVEPAAVAVSGGVPLTLCRRLGTARFAVVAPGRSLPVEVAAVPDPRTFSQATVGLDAGWLVPAPGVLVTGVAGGDALVGLGH